MQKENVMFHSIFSFIENLELAVISKKWVH